MTDEPAMKPCESLDACLLRSDEFEAIAIEWIKAHPQRGADLIYKLTDVLTDVLLPDGPD